MRRDFGHVDSILRRYENLSVTDNPTSLDIDFKKIVRELPFHVLEPSLSLAFRSDDTPPIFKIVESSFGKAPKDFKWGFVNALRRDPFAHNLLEGGFITLEEVEKVPSETMADLVSSLTSINPEISDIIARHYAQFPGVLFDLDPPIRVGILTNLARNRPMLLQSLEGKDAHVPIIEEVTVEKEEGSASAAVESAPTPRYAAVRFFAETEPWVRGNEFAADALIQENRWYQAEVSIGLKPAGVMPAEEPRAIREPKQDHPVDILVTAESKDFKIIARVAKLVLPPVGESTEQAVFRIMPLRHSITPEDRLSIRFRLFYKLNLLQVLTLRGRVLPAIEDVGPSCQLIPFELTYGRQADANDFDVMRPCALHIAVDPEQQQYQMTFTLKREGIENELAFSGTLALSAPELESAIAGVRKSLFRVCSSPTMGERVEGLDWEYADHLKELATRGCKLWSLLFDPGREDEMSVIGEWLKNNPLPEGSTIQVSVDPGAASFVFSWSVLYDRPCLSGDFFSEDGFWGLRYVIEQKPIKRLLLAGSGARPTEIEIGAMYWNFAQTPDQQMYLRGLVESTKKVRLALGGSIDEADKARKCLQECASDVIYFYTHGYTGLPDGGHYGVTIQDFLDLFEKLPVDSPTRKAWKYIYDRVQEKQYQSDQSWIALTNGKLLLDDLYEQVIKLPSRPFVILNMCDSAQITPTLSRSFVDFFLTRGSRAVIGTECSMRPVFADFVGRALLRALLEAKPIGQALRDVRRDAAKKKNLLGLAYTLFGSADAALILPE